MIALFALGAAFAGVVAAGAAPEAAYAPRRVAVLVGVQDYADPALQGLKFPEKDARDLGGVLGAPEVGGFDRVFVISGREATSRSGLLKAIKVAVADLQRDDTFLLYLSGHGTLSIDPIEGSQLFFLPSDSRLEQPESTGLAVADIEALVHDLPARRRVLILDTCHNGRLGSRSAVSTPTQQLISGFRGEPPAPRGVRDVSESEARLYAAQYWQPAMEDPELGNGVYTHYLIDALTGARSKADLDEDGLVDVAEAHEYARDRTMTWTGGVQIPRAEYRIVGREDIYLSGAESLRGAAERALIAACDALLSRAKLFVNGTARGTLPGLYAVDPGVQTLEVRTDDGRTIFKDQVTFRAGETLPLEDLLRRKAATLTALGGVAVHGGNPGVQLLRGSVGLVWANPVPLSGPWRTEARLTADAATGVAEAGVDQTSGAIAAGVGFGPQLGVGWAGLTADVRDVWRTSAYGSQATLGGSGGVAAGVDFPLRGDFQLSARVDAWVGSEAVYDEAALTYGGGLRVGVGSKLP